MRGKFKKVVAFLTSAIVLSVSSVVAFPVSAAGDLTTNVELGQTSFSGAWSKIWYFDCGDYAGSMTVGYDTSWTNKDYVNLFGTKAGKHYAAVKNSEEKIEYTDTASSGSSTGRAEVKHTGVPVTYYAFWDVSR